MGYELSLTNGNFQIKFDHWNYQYPYIPEFSQPDVKKCAWEMVHHDLYAIADKEKYSPRYMFGDYTPGKKGFSFPMVNCGLLPDPSLASTLLGKLHTTLVRIVLFIRSFAFFNTYAYEAHELLDLYNRVKEGAATRFALAREMNFNFQGLPFDNKDGWFFPSNNGRRLYELDWKLFSFGGHKSQTVETITYLAKKMHDLRSQCRATDNLDGCFKDHSNFLTRTVKPLRELMFIRQQLFVEIVDAAEHYPLFGKATPVDLPSLQKYRQKVDEVLKPIKDYSKSDFDQGALYYWSTLK